MILKIGTAELHVVFNDGIKTFAGRLSFDRKDETGTKQTAPKIILTLIVQLAHTLRLNA